MLLSLVSLGLTLTAVVFLGFGETASPGKMKFAGKVSFYATMTTVMRLDLNLIGRACGLALLRPAPLHASISSLA